MEADQSRMKKGWFVTPGREGDRTIQQQLIGLDWLLANVKGKRVFDAGCAEGLISAALLDAGASVVHGVDRREDAIEIARKVCGPSAAFWVADLDTWEPFLSYDIVIGLGILHKLKSPNAAAIFLAAAAREHVVWRLPPETAPMVVDARSNYRPHDIDAVMRLMDFKLLHATPGPFNEWVGVYERMEPWTR